MDEIDEDHPQEKVEASSSQPARSMRAAAQSRHAKKGGKGAKGAANLLKTGTSSKASSYQDGTLGPKGGSGGDAQFDGQSEWSGTADALDQFINGADPAVRMEAMKVRLAATMDRYAFFNNTRLGFSRLSAQQNRSLEFDIRCRSGAALRTRFQRGVPEVKRLLNGQKVQHTEHGTVHQRLRMIDTFVRKENVRTNPDSPPPVKKISHIRESLNTELPSYSDLMSGKVGSTAGEPVLATTCGIPASSKQPLGMSKSSPVI